MKSLLRFIAVIATIVLLSITAGTLSASALPHCSGEVPLPPACSNPPKPQPAPPRSLSQTIEPAADSTNSVLVVVDLSGRVLPEYSSGQQTGYYIYLTCEDGYQVYGRSTYSLPSTYPRSVLTWTASVPIGTAGPCTVTSYDATNLHLTTGVTQSWSNSSGTHTDWMITFFSSR